MRKLSLRHIALGLALIAPLSAVQAQDHRYLLNNSFADQFSGPSLVGNAAGLSSSGYAFNPRNGGLSLSNVLTSPVYTILFRTRIANPVNGGANFGYQKLVDFQNRTSDNGFYLNTTTAEFWNGGAQSTALGGYGVTPHASRVTILTRDVTGLFSTYIQGVLQHSFMDTAGDALFTGPGNIATFFDDDTITGGTEDPTGLVNYIAVWEDYAMTRNQAANWESSSITATPEPATITLLATGLLGVFAAARRRRKVA